MRSTPAPPASADRLAPFAAALRARARTRGRQAALRPEEIDAVATRVALLDLAAEELGLYGAPPARNRRDSGLTAEEEKLLFPGAKRRLPGVPADYDPRAHHRAHLASLRADSMSAEEASKLLGVNPSRIRQRLGGRPRTLLGMKVGRAWRVFRYQLDGAELVPNLGQVIAAMPRGHDPGGEHNWLTLPSQELELGGDLVSPLTWLRAGQDVAFLVERARLLAWWP